MLPGVDYEVLGIGLLVAAGVYYLFTLVLGRLHNVRSHKPRFRRRRDQLDTVASASFTPKKVMNFSEYKLFREIERSISNLHGYRLFAQTAMGELLTAVEEDAHWTVHAKRIDIVIIAPSGYAALAIEYQGKGHYGGGAIVRDAVKREAFRKAGIPFLEVPDGYDPARTMAEIRDILRAGARPGPNEEYVDAEPVKTTFGMRQAKFARDM